MGWFFWSCDLYLSPLIIVSPDYSFRSVPDVHRGWGWDGSFGVVIYVCLPWLLSLLIIISDLYQMYTEAEDGMIVLELWFIFVSPDYCLPLIIVSPDYSFRSVPDVHRGWGTDGCFRVVTYVCLLWVFELWVMFVSPDYCLPWLFFRSVPDVHRGWGWNGCIRVVIYVCLPWLLSPLIIISDLYQIYTESEDVMVVFELWFMFVSPDYCLPWLLFQTCTRYTQRLTMEWLYLSCDLYLSPFD